MNSELGDYIADEYGNMHYLAEELARGGQGVVFRTSDSNLAIKQPLDNGHLAQNTNQRELFRHIRTLPLPNGVHISMPLAILRDKPGYVMKLLKEMHPFADFSLNGEKRNEMAKEELPVWVSQIPDKKFAQELAYYAQTGSTRFRLYALYKCASNLARLHNAGLVYGDVSTNNVFIGKEAPCDCWLIDADNLRPEPTTGGRIIYTPCLGAPELVQLKDAPRPRTDCWAFAVMAFQLLALCHPFIGKKVLDPDEEEDGGWDSEPTQEGIPTDLDEQAYAGYMPYIDDEQDDSNAFTGGLPRSLILTPSLQCLFQETFGAGRLQPHRRPAMTFWALELARAFDNSIVCPSCKMSYYHTPKFKQCPYCGNSQPPFVIARTKRGQMNLFDNNKDEFQTVLPDRLFSPFSLTASDSAQYEVEVCLSEKTIKSVRGTKPLPSQSDLTFEFVNIAK